MEEKQSKVLWESPWGYAESFLITFGVFIACLALDASVGAAPRLSFPDNLIAGGLIIVTIIISFIIKSKNHALLWLSSIPAAIASITLFVVVSVLMATIPQTDGAINPFYSILESWMYNGAYVLVLLTLGNATLKRLWPLEFKNATYILNHLGLFIALFAGGIGAGDVQKVNMKLFEGSSVFHAHDKDNNEIVFPFAVELTKFSMEEFLPKIALVDSNNDIITKNGRMCMVDMDTVNPMQVGDVSFSVKDFYAHAQYWEKSYRPVYDYGSAPVAKIQIEGVDTTNWLSNGNFMCPPAFVQVADSIYLKMVKPAPKRFYSKVKIYTPEAELPAHETIEVNYPLEVGDWKLYQVSYDESKGKWSRTSGIELVKDPWLPWVYVGLFMMIAGSVLLIFRKKKNDNLELDK